MNQVINLVKCKTQDILILVKKKKYNRRSQQLNFIKHLYVF